MKITIDNNEKINEFINDIKFNYNEFLNHITNNTTPNYRKIKNISFDKSVPNYSFFNKMIKINNDLPNSEDEFAKLSTKWYKYYLSSFK